MERTSTRNILLLLSAALFAQQATAQTVLIDEHFTGGLSTTGFVSTMDGGDCQWIYAPGGLTPNVFNQDYGDTIPAGGGFDSDFAFIDSDECTGSGGTVNTYLTSAAFDASAAGSYHLTFAHQFKARLGSFCRVEVHNGSAWIQVANWTGDNVGFPNPAVNEDLDITTATGGSATSQVRFQFNAGWDWWWALDNVQVTFTEASGINETGRAAAVRVFPNPVNDVLNVPYAASDAVHLSIVDATGRSVQERSMARTIGVEELAPGAYTLLLRDNVGNVRARSSFVKQ